MNTIPIGDDQPGKSQMTDWMDNPFLIMAITLAAIMGGGLTVAVLITVIVR